ncbi:unnamed protein product, partial [Prorocentrum cordatum]
PGGRYLLRHTAFAEGAADPAGAPEAAAGGGGGSSMDVLGKVLKDMQDFEKGFGILKQGGKGKVQVPESLAINWASIYKQKDRLGKIKDELWMCQQKEEAPPRAPTQRGIPTPATPGRRWRVRS